MQQNWVRVVLFVMNNKEKFVWDCIYVILAIWTQWKYEIMSYLNNCLFRKSNPRVGEGGGGLFKTEHLFSPMWNYQSLYLAFWGHKFLGNKEILKAHISGAEAKINKQ